MDRYIWIYPQKQYSFRPNSSYRDQWSFLPDEQRVKVIAEQLTYLEFHEWLSNNLRHTIGPKPRNSDLNTLRFHVAEGFFRTDVLLYASICEAALYVVAKDFFNSNKQKPPDLRAAFETSVDTTTPLNDKTFTLIGSSALISGKIKICSKKVIRKKDRDISFDSLIKAARAIDAIDDDLEQKIDALREARNTIHLAAHIARKQAEPRPFAESDRQQAKQVVEQLRVQLSSYYQPF